SQRWLMSSLRGARSATKKSPPHGRHKRRDCFASLAMTAVMAADSIAAIRYNASMNLFNTTGPVLWSVDGRGVATVTLNRPEVNNAYNGELIQGLLAALDALGGAP